jgi:hypothetical protein
MRSSFVKFSMLTCFGFLDCFYTIGGQLISGIDKRQKAKGISWVQKYKNFYCLLPTAYLLLPVA